MLERMPDTSLCSLHSWPVVNVASQSAQPGAERERVVEFAQAPSEERYLAAVADAINALADSAAVLVLSLGYDTVADSDPCCWSFSPQVLLEIGGLLATSELPVFVVQEGGYALDSLAECGYAFVSGLLTPVGQPEGDDCGGLAASSAMPAGATTLSPYTDTPVLVPAGSWISQAMAPLLSSNANSLPLKAGTSTMSLTAVAAP